MHRVEYPPPYRCLDKNLNQISFFSCSDGTKIESFTVVIITVGIHPDLLHSILKPTSDLQILLYFLNHSFECDECNFICFYAQS